MAGGRRGRRPLFRTVVLGRSPATAQAGWARRAAEAPATRPNTTQLL
jgi:hypothetical protein